ncbi:Fanconi anemia group F protein [Erinaceus europaeus]|uniref:Fanconi anemia group F protein n=1 Tax=Erinaceus europaeus TaxID=9365 RepID=A0ABM3W8U0_ERIEU|nr:Fanconi anemia group F protein [Erinaceus europaeus]
MESLLRQLECFSELLAVSRSPHVRTWEPATVSRALQWARYLRHVHGRLSRHERVRLALRRLLKDGGARGAAMAPGLPDLQALGRGDLLLALRLLDNRALGPAACHRLLQELGPGGPDDPRDSLSARAALLARRRSAVRLLLGAVPAAPGGCVVRTQARLLLTRLQEARGAAHGLLHVLWGRCPRDSLLQVTACALGPPPREGHLHPDGPQAAPELARWLLDTPEVVEAFCRDLPAGLVTSAACSHPALARAYLRLLSQWGGQLLYDLPTGVWAAAADKHVSWQDLCGRFQSLCQAPPPLRDQAVATLQANKAQDGDFEVPGISVWTDLLLALGGAVR